jgi:UDP:flavonoid glycosyltransferase YjiC (YdhE family)
LFSIAGYATTSDKELWRAFREEAIDAYKEDWNSYNTWIQEQGAEPLKDPTCFYNPSPYLNLYLCPDELDYTDIRPRPDKWHNIDWLMREEKESDGKEFDLAKEFGSQWENIKARDDKVIYLSMGSIGAADVRLMKRLVGILSGSPHRIIVSKGPLGDEYELASNMVGKNHVPQTKILPLVDCVITHGGNNTLTETLYHGKPMIVMPIFADQYDNAQRMVEKKLGERCDPYYCGEKELLDKIEKLLLSVSLKERLDVMGARMQQSSSKERAVELIEKLVKEMKEK